MNEATTMILVFLAGAALGVLFFGGLWLTVKKLVTAKTPALMIVGSFFLRTGITLIGFYFIGGDNWIRILECLLGFMTARFAVLYFTKSIDAKQLNLTTKKEFHGTQS